jgi:hypothetical protein
MKDSKTEMKSHNQNLYDLLPSDLLKDEEDNNTVISSNSSEDEDNNNFLKVKYN